jgi:hypothetical protein
MLVDWMDTIDLHSADPPYTVIRVVGSMLTPKGRQVLRTFGFDSFRVTDEGFHALRPLQPRLRKNQQVDISWFMQSQLRISWVLWVP